MWEQEFVLLYNISGMTANRVGRMNLKERLWWFNRLKKQKDDEANAAKTKNNNKWWES